MIPPLLLAGVLFGVGLGSRGIGIGASNDVLTGLGAAGLAAVNVAVGIVVGAFVGWVARRASALAS